MPLPFRETLILLDLKLAPPERPTRSAPEEANHAQPTR
jgi:hypothetical protein